MLFIFWLSFPFHVSAIGTAAQLMNYVKPLLILYRVFYFLLSSKTPHPHAVLKCKPTAVCFCSAGLLGPTLRAAEGETIVVTFRNMATGVHSIHPHGVAYGKQSEGANYFDNTSQKEKEDDVVHPDGEHVYSWEVTSDVSPQQADPTCLTYTYISHRHVVEDYNSGLVGALLICKPGSLDESGNQIDVSQEYVFLFGVFDEKESKYKPNGDAPDDHVKYTINGYTAGSLPDVSVCAHASVSLHLAGMSSEPEVFSVHINGQVLQQNGHKVSSVGLISGSTATARVVAVHPGRWLLSSHTSKHVEGKVCSFALAKESREWIYYIAAEETVWDYAPNTQQHVDEDFKLQYLKQSPTRVGQKYKKAVYTLYNNASFTERTESKQRKDELGILGPVIRAQIRDVIKIVFKNMASRPYSIYPHGLTILKSEEGFNYPEGGTESCNQSHGVQPGETHTYVWRVGEEDEPLQGDSRCLTRMYHSAVDAPRDIASGLIGPILICKSQSLNVRNVQLKADKEQHAIFAVFDENKSWYLDYNIGHYCDRTKVNKADEDFYKSNVMHTINGYTFESGPVLGFCNGEIATWHVSSMGAQDYIQTATFYGHTFELNERTEDFLSLYPMTGETITMHLDNVGVWLLVSLNSHETTKGMRVKFNDVECYRDHQYEYSDYDNTEITKEFTVWTPQKMDDIKKEAEKSEPSKITQGETDIYTDMFADELGLRSLKNQSTGADEDLINMPVVIGVPRPDFSNYELYVPGDEPDHLGYEQDVKADEYEYVTYKDPYSSHEDFKNINLDDSTKYYLKFSGPNVKTYFISAEEVEWDYSGYGQSRKTTFVKVIFRSYIDSSFSTPDIRGEMDEHLGILGPVIKAEVGQSIMVVFRNNANRPYSIHPNGVSYTKQTEGLSYEDGSKYWYKYDNEVQPNTTFTYLWKVPSMVGPMPDESHCRTWAYYSGVNPEKDIHTGLIGPLLVCREGTLNENVPDMREFMLLFMTFDESQSWYFEKNQEMICLCVVSPAINGIIYNLKGLRMYTNQLVRWHLINMGSPKDFQSVHFHGQTFLHKKITSYRQAVYPLLPGGFATLEMYLSKPGLWQLETEIGFNQQKGMQTLFLVLDNDCYRPLGLQSGSVKDNQITAINTRGYWEPNLARLNNQGKYNAWSTEQNNSWIQVDFQRPVVISQVATQGAKQMFQSQYVLKFSISYSTDRRKWIFYKGDSRDLRKEAYGTQRNTFFPPVVGRFIRLHPLHWYNKATVRMEFYGCELDGCSMPLGLESGVIEDRRITASSEASNWYSGPWRPSLARLNRQGAVNAWQAKYNDMSEWLQVELPHVKKITGIITQGAKSLGKEMYVTSYALQYSDNGIHWNQYTDDEEETFSGNTDNNGHMKNYIYPPIFSRFIRILPRRWTGSITMRVELLGCDFE
uniref:ferroxidase n=1 Tax=Scophthalmus maximus TaxID=52904 RepID=A0A8D3BJD3_SCOMX